MIAPDLLMSLLWGALIVLLVWSFMPSDMNRLCGVLTLTVHTTGTLAKLFSEAVEAIDPRPVEGIRATGSSRLQEIV